MKSAVVILAGGEGARIGGGKPLRLLGGKTLLGRALDYAASQANRVAVAVRDVRQVGDIRVAVIRDDPAIEGPVGGLVAALRFARDEGADAVLTLPTDMPFLPSDLADRFSTELRECGAAIARSGAHLHPVCGLWRTKALDRIPSYLASGKRSLKGFAETVGYATVEWPSHPADPFFNINTPADLAAAEQRLQG